MNKQIKCQNCGNKCKTGMYRLSDGYIVCATCIYEYLGSDNDNGHDWNFSTIESAARKIRDNNL